MRRSAVAALALMVGALAVTSGCAPAAPELTPVDAGFHPPASGAAAFVEPGSSLPPLAQRTAPAKPFAVGSREIEFSRGDRPLRTVIWYPATGRAGGPIRANVAAAAGRFPLVLFSHGLTSSPERMRSVTSNLAAAGFVVAAPAYPFTSQGAPAFRPGDVANQPADASLVIGAVLDLGSRSGDVLAGHLDPDRIGAAGHSAGGFTTAGLLTGTTHDGRIRAAVIISGGLLSGPLSGAATPVLFIHGETDRVVGYAKGRAAYDNLAWPKGFLTILGGDHTQPVSDPVALRTMVEFLRWTLYGDPAAQARLATVTASEKTRYESAW